MPSSAAQDLVMASAPVSAANSTGVSSPATAAASPQFGPGHAPTLGPGDEDGEQRYGLLGLLNVLHTSNTDLRTLALGLDLTTLGLDLNPAREMHPSFVSPWTGVRKKMGEIIVCVRKWEKLLSRWRAGA